MSNDLWSWMAEIPEPKPKKAPEKTAARSVALPDVPSSGSPTSVLRKAGAEIKDTDEPSATEGIDAPGRAGD